MPLLRSADVQVRRGTLSFSPSNLGRNVTFSSPLPVPYDIFWKTPNVSVNVSVTAQNAAGFTMAVGLSLGNMDLEYLAVERRV